MNVKILVRYLRVNLLGQGPRLIKKKIFYRAAVSQRLRNTALEYSMLSSIFEPKTDEVTGEWRRRHTEELYDLTFSQNIILLNKPRRMN